MAEFGRKEITLAEHEMPGLMAVRRSTAQPAARGRADHRLAAHDDPDRRADRDAGRARGRGPWACCNIFSTQDHAAAAIAVGPDGTPEDPRGIPVFAWKGETLEEYWWCTEQALTWPGGSGPNMLLDDGGDATLLVHKGAEFEAAGRCPARRDDDPEEWQVVLGPLRGSLTAAPGKWTEVGRRDHRRDRGDHDRRAPAL